MFMYFSFQNKSKSLPEIYNFSESMGTQPTNLPTEGRATPVSTDVPSTLNMYYYDIVNCGSNLLQHEHVYVSRREFLQLFTSR